MKSSFQITGMKETSDVFEKLQNEIGDKTSRSKVLLPAVKEAMKPVLAMAKTTAPFDEENQGLHLRDTLTIVGRKPTRNDKKSKYISNTDTVVAIVTSKPIPKKIKKLAVGMGKTERKDFYKSQNVLYDARAMFQEFGTAKMSAQPFMRPALESQAVTVSNTLATILKQKIEQYRSKNT